MADFISGADLVARGAEGTGAAVVLNNQQTIQNLARLGSRMDNLYKTQEMLKLKLAAAKQPKPEKQPNLNPFATKAILSKTLNKNANELVQLYSDLGREDYNQFVANNDNIGANQVVADVASNIDKLGPTAQNFDNSISDFLEKNKDFYGQTNQVVQSIQSQFPRIDPNEWSKLTTRADQRKYLNDKINSFSQSDPQGILKNAFLFNPDSWNYGGVGDVIRKRTADNQIQSEISTGNTTGRSMTYNELFDIDTQKQTAWLNYDRALSAIQQVPQANEQLGAYVAMEKSKVDKDPANSLLSTAELEKRKNDAGVKAAKEYADKVFSNGLKLETKRKFVDETKAAEALENGKVRANAPKVAEGPQTFTVNANIHLHANRKNTNQLTGIKNIDYPVVTQGETLVYKEFPLNPGMPFVPMTMVKDENGNIVGTGLEDLKARGYNNRNVKDGIMYVSGIGATASNVTNAKGGVPMFERYVRDSTPGHEGEVYYPGDFVPPWLLTAKKMRNGKPVDYLEARDYFLPTGLIASPEVKTTNGVGQTESKATMTNFYPDTDYQNRVFKALTEGAKMRKNDLFNKPKN